jgi:hypothetical protein
MTLRAGRRAGEGDIELQNLPRPDISVRHNGSFDVSVEAEPRRAVLHLSGADEYPPVIEAWVRFPEERSCVLRLPFPAARRRFVRAAGARDLNGTRTTLDRLPGIWGSVMTPSQTADYRLEARFGGESVVVGRLELAASGALELSLERVMADVEDFLTSTADLDAVVELRIVRLGTEDPGPPPVLQVGRYDCQFEPQAADERGNREFGFDEENGNCLSAEELEALRVEACPMWNPLADAELVPIMDGGRWLLPVGEGRIGPWLVTGWIGDRLRVRPLLLTFGRDTTWNFERDIERAVTTEGFDARQAQLDRLLEAMADNPEHPDWEILEGFLEKLRTHSPSTFEIIVALTRHQRMMAQLALRLAGRALLRDFWAAMERLPFLWSSIPVSIWMEAGTRMQEFIARGVAIAAENDVNLDAKELFRNRVRNWSEGVRELFPAVEVLVEFISMRYPEVEPRECPISLSPATIDGFENDERNILLRTHADEWWPDRHPNEIRRIADLQDVELDDLLHPNPHDYQFAALNAPVVTAVACAYDRPVSSIPELRHIRHFDVAWFERAFAFTLARAIARRRENEPEFIDA